MPSVRRGGSHGSSGKVCSSSAEAGSLRVTIFEEMTWRAHRVKIMLAMDPCANVEAEHGRWFG